MLRGESHGARLIGVKRRQRSPAHDSPSLLSRLDLCCDAARRCAASLFSAHPSCVAPRIALCNRLPTSTTYVDPARAVTLAALYIASELSTAALLSSYAPFVSTPVLILASCCDGGDHNIARRVAFSGLQVSTVVPCGRPAPVLTLLPLVEAAIAQQHASVVGLWLPQQHWTSAEGPERVDEVAVPPSAGLDNGYLRLRALSGPGWTQRCSRLLALADSAATAAADGCDDRCDASFDRRPRIVPPATLKQRHPAETRDTTRGRPPPRRPGGGGDARSVAVIDVD